MQRCSFLLIAAVVSFGCLSARGSFNTVINVPPDMAPATIGSSTQLNVFAGGTLPSGFTAGVYNKISTDIEVNFGSGATAESITDDGGSTINITGGTISQYVSSLHGTLNISGGVMASVGAGGSTVNISGGVISGGGTINAQSILNISGGSLGPNVYANEAQSIVFSGGSIGDGFHNSNGFPVAPMTIIGGDFRANGQLVAGLDSVGNSVLLPNTVETLTGTLADGRSFAFSVHDRDSVTFTFVTLVRTELPAITQTLITVPTDGAPLGVRQGQTLIANSGGALADNFYAGYGSNVQIGSGATVGANFEATATNLKVTGGSIGDGFNSIGSNVVVSGGTFGARSTAFDHSTLDISGGNFGRNFTVFNSTIRISGGSFDQLNLATTVEATITGGTFSDNTHAGAVNATIAGGSFGDHFEADYGSDVSVYGGTFGEQFQALSNSKVHLFGYNFKLDGQAIPSLVLGQPHTLTVRFETLTGNFANGTPFSFYLSANQSQGTDFFSLNSQLTLTQVLPGDYNGDGIVNSADYTIWRESEGRVIAIGEGADGNFDGVIDGNDYSVWRSHFGERAMSAAGSAAAVPEPTTAWLLAVGVGTVMINRQSRAGRTAR